jgi:flagellar motor switch protein FliN
VTEPEPPGPTPAKPKPAAGAAHAPSGAVVYEQLDQEAQSTGAAHAPNGTVEGLPFGAQPHDGADLRRLSDVPMELSVEIGRTRMTVGETLQLRVGSIVTLERLAGEPVDLLVNGTPIARGEVVIIDEEFGLRVTEIVEGDSRAPDLDEQLLADASPPAAPDPGPPVPAHADPAMQE